MSSKFDFALIFLFVLGTIHHHDDAIFLSPIKKIGEDHLILEHTRPSDNDEIASREFSGAAMTHLDCVIHGGSAARIRTSRDAEVLAPSNAHQHPADSQRNCVLNVSLPPDQHQNLPAQQHRAADPQSSSCQRASGSAHPTRPSFPTEFNPASASKLVQDRMLRYSEKIRALTGVVEAPLLRKLNDSGEDISMFASSSRRKN